MLKTCPFNLDVLRPRILWEITNRCNLHCKHCLYYSGEERPRELTFNQVAEVAQKIAADGRIREVWLSGGEPMMREDIYNIAALIRDYGMTPSISSNGTLIDECEARRLHNCGVQYVHVSIDGIDAATHDALRGSYGAFFKTLRCVRALRDEGISVGASFMVTSQSVHQVKAMADFAHDLGLSTISFYQVEPLGRAIGKNFGAKDRLSSTLLQARSAIEKQYEGHAWRLEFPRLFDKEDAPLECCHAESFLTITADGQLGVCPWLMKSPGCYSAGNVLEIDFAEAWTRCQNYVQHLMEQRYKHSRCLNCPYSADCGRGCPAVSIRTPDFPTGYDYACTRGK